MELDDSFITDLLQRRKATKEYLSTKKIESLPTVGKKRAVLTDDQHSSNQADEPPEESPKRLCIEHLSKGNENEKENMCMEEDQYVPFKASTSKGLAALRKKNPLDTNQEEEQNCNQATCEPEVLKSKTYVFSTNSSDLCASRQSRLNNLAANINQWEDDLRRTALTTNNVTSSAPHKPSNSSSSSDSNSFAMKLYYTDKAPDNALQISNGSGAQSISTTGPGEVSNFVKGSSMPPPIKKANIESDGKSVKRTARLDDTWDQAVKAALETEELVSSPVKQVAKGTVVDFEEQAPKEIPSGNLHSEHRKKFEGTSTNNGCKEKAPAALNKSLDPAELPLSARRALFEKTMLGGCVKPHETAFEPKLSVAQRAAMFEKASNGNSKPTPHASFGMQKRLFSQNASSSTKPSFATNQNVLSPPPLQHSPVKQVATIQKVENNVLANDVLKNSPVKKMNPPPASSPLSASKNTGSHTRLVQHQLIERAAGHWQEKDLGAKALDEPKKEISSLVNHWEKLSSSSSVENNTSEEERLVSMPEETEADMYSSEEEPASELESEYTERESEFELDEKIQQDEDILESSVSDQEDLDVEADPDVFNSPGSAGEEQLPEFKVPSVNENETRSYEERGSETDAGTPSFKSSSISVGSSFASRSLSITSGSSTGSYESKEQVPTPTTSSNDPNAGASLQYTVSFYRKQKQETRTPPVKTIVRREQIESPPSDDSKAQVIQERIKLLQEEILRQQTVIGQTSQALNLCHATAEFAGSSEQVEGERLLLIATQKRQACLNEIQRLKSHGAQRENIADGTGTLTITDIQLPLKREFIAAQLEEKLNDAVHCFLCLIRHGPQVIVTQMVSTSDKISDGALCFTNHIKLQNLPPDFSVVCEIYALQTKKEQLPHDKKYHIKREHSKIRLTHKGKKTDGKLTHPSISSPGGPNAVRSSCFGVVGFTRFTIQNCNKSCFTLDKVPFTSPLEGVLKVKLHLHAEHKVTEKGFLTMFEVVSGFGAWHRRWCYLNSQYLIYWKYPDDEHKKDPIGMVDLKQCVTGQVKLVARDICARPHTFEIVTVRPREKGDRDTPKSKQGNPLKTTKHLLSADTKEERILWCNKFNEALMNVRKWDPLALKPMEVMHD